MSGIRLQYVVCGLTASFLMSGCIKSFHEKRLGEELWEVGYTDIAICDKAASAEACIDNLKPNITKRGQELCGPRLNAAIGACEKTQRKGLYAVVCEVSCTEKMESKRTVPISIVSSEHSSYEESTAQLRVILNSRKLKDLFQGNGIAAVMRSDKDSFILVSHNQELCVKGVTTAGSQGDFVLKTVDRVSCSQLDKSH